MSGDSQVGPQSSFLVTILSWTLILADQPNELELVILDLKPTHVSAVCITILIEAETAGDAFEVSGVAQSFEDLGSILSPGAFDRIDGDNGRLVGIHGPADRLLLVLRLIIREEALAHLSGELIGRQPSKRHVNI